MRVLAGRYKSKLIRTINDPLTRPMMSKVRESIFNSLQFNIENKDNLDLYAGSGSLGIESLSRGANFVTFIENSDDCITILKQNLKEFENNQKHKKLMKSIYKKIIFIISAIALFSVIVGVVKYSLTYIENNPEKYLPTQK